MKRYAAICILIMLVLPFVAYGSAPSPTLEALYTFKPDVDYVLFDPNPMLFMWSPHNPWTILSNWDNDIDIGRFHLDDALILYLTEPLPQVEVQFVLTYHETNTIYAIFIDSNNTPYISQGTITSCGTVIFDMVGVPAEEVIMYVMSDIYEG